MRLTISTDFSGIQKRLDQMREDIGRRALASAVNKTIAQAKTQMQREITAEFKVSAAYVRERLSVTRARGTGRLAIEATLRGGKGAKRSANLIRFLERSVTLAEGRRRAKRGTQNVLHVQIKRRGGRKPIKGAFIGNSGRTMFVREGKARLPIRPVQTIDVAQMFNAKRINAKVVEMMRRRLHEIFAHEARFYLGKYGGGR